MTNVGSPPAPPARAGKRVLGTLFLVVFIDLVGFGMIVPLIARYGELYQLHGFELSLLGAAYSLCQFLFAPILGRLSDRYGRRPVLILSLFGSIVGYVLLGFAGSAAMLFASRIIAGAAAGNIGTAQAVIADSTTPDRRAQGMGIIGAAIGLGFVFGPALGGFLFEKGRSLPGFAAACTSAIALLLVITLLPETRFVSAAPRPARPRMDLRSLAVALGHPLLGLAIVSYFLATYGFSNFEQGFVLYSEHRFGMTPRETGEVFFLVGVLGAIVQGGLVRRLSQRFGEARLVVAGAVFAGVGLALLPLMHTVPLLRIELCLLALGSGLLNPSLSSLTSKLVDQDEVGGTLGIFQGMGSLARVFGPFTAIQLSEDLGRAWPFGVASVQYVIVLGLSLALLSRLASRSPHTSQ